MMIVRTAMMNCMSMECMGMVCCAMKCHHTASFAA